MNRAALFQTCRSFGVRRLSLFACGPIGRTGTAVLVEMPLGEPVDLPALQRALKGAFGAELEVFSEATLPPRSRHYVLAIARLEYSAARASANTARAGGGLGKLILIPLAVCALLFLIAARAGNLSHPISALARMVAAHYR
jgi:hypothetical protein